MDTGFFALISRMRHIGRWGLMRNNEKENIQEHSHMVAVLAHALAVMRRDIFSGQIDPNECAARALYHDAAEIITGDLPTPIKYHNREIMSAYRQVEELAAKKLLYMLPEELRGSYEPLLCAGGDEVYALVKAADKIAAYIKCVEERKAGNDEFASAERQTLSWLEESPLPEVRYFLDNFMPAFELTLDELGAFSGK